jgi:hypothetical protein
LACIFLACNFLAEFSAQAICKGGVFGAGHTFSKVQLKPLVDKGYIGESYYSLASDCVSVYIHVYFYV